MYFSPRRYGFTPFGSAPASESDSVVIAGTGPGGLIATARDAR